MSSVGTIHSWSRTTFPLAARADIRSRRVVVRRPVPGAAVVAVTDCAIATGLLGTALVVSNLGAMPSGIDDVLSVRITLKNLLLLALVIPAWVFVFRACGLYDVPDKRAEGEPWRIFAACGLSACIGGVFAVANPGGALRPTDLVVLWWVASGSLVVSHVCWRWWFRRRRLLTRRRILIVGTGPLAVRMLRALADDPDVSYEIVGFVDTVTARPALPSIARRTIATLDSLGAILMRDAIDEVIVALPAKSCYLEIQDTLRSCERVGVSAKYRADLFETEVAWPKCEPGVDPIVTMQVTPDDYRLAVKRTLDIVATTALLVALAPLIAAIAVAIKLTSPGPVLFVQERYGLNRRRFRMVKFRTMVADADRLQATLEDRNEADGAVFKIANDPRVTLLGRFLRRTSLDELPQLFNVLRGEMSLVGPRPLPVRDVARFTDAANMRRFSVRPGLTCLWQISGRNKLSFNDWMRLDLSYIDGWSLGLDLQILLRTVPAVLRCTGAH